MTIKGIARYQFTAVAACAWLIAATPAMLRAQRQPAGTTFSIRNVTVIDVERGALLADRTIVVRGSRIVAAGPSAAVAPPSGAPTIDGRGKFLMPGVWDMHAHPFHNIPARTLPLAVAYGVTGIREMGGGLQHMAEATRLIDEGLVAPRMIVAGPLLDGVPQGENFPPGTGLTILTADEGREVVNRLVAQRVHLVKIHNGLSREAYLAIAEEAKRWRLPFDGHLPVGMSIVEVSDAGQRTVEHSGALGPVCVSDPAVLQQGRGTPPPVAPIEIDQRRCEEALGRLARNGTWLTPTIGAPGQGNARTRAFNLALVRMAFAAGVRLLPGTDWPGGGYWRGQYATATRTPWDDLAGMVEAGLTPAEALRVGILNPALLVGMENQLGRVEAGYLADLVLLDADPLVDIANAKRISAVVANGRLVDTVQRRQILDNELAAQNRTSRQ